MTSLHALPGRISPPPHFIVIFLFAAVFGSQVCAQERGSGLRFVPNRGQVATTDGRGAGHDVEYQAAGPGISVYVSRRRVSLVPFAVESALPDGTSGAGDPVDWLSNGSIAERRMRGLGPVSVRGHRVDIEFVGARGSASAVPFDESDDYVNIYRGGADPIEYLRSYTTLHYRNLWDGIDLVLKGVGSGLKYEFVVHAGADVARIRLRYVGADAVGIEAGGVVIGTTLGSIHDAPPVVFQHGEDGHVADTVVASVRLQGNDLTFDVGEYDSSRDLIIDPTLVWSTYYGGSGADYGGFYTTGTQYVGNALALDTAGNVYTCGKSYSTTFPVSPGAFQTTPGNSPINEDAFIVSFTKTGARRWATYVGGSGGETASGIAYGGGFLAFQGSTSSPNFPVTGGALSTTRQGVYDAFVARFSTSGLRVWATYLGGSGNEFGGGIGVDNTGHVCVVGTSTSANFPVSPGAYRSTAVGQETYLARLDQFGGRRWATYVGGSSADESAGIGIDTSGHIAITIRTQSTDFPTTSGTHRQSWTPTGGADFECVLAMFDTVGSYQWGTYFGGNGNDLPRGVAIDGTGHVYLTGGTHSTNLPTTATSLQATHGGVPVGLQNIHQDAFIARFTSGGQLHWCTYYGYYVTDYASGVSAGWNGHVYVAGAASSANVVRTGVSYDPVYHGGGDGFLLELDSNGRGVWDTYIGGSAIDYALAIIGDEAGSLYVSGYTSSTDFPVINAYQSTFAGGYDMFVSRFCNSLYPRLDISGPLSFCIGDSVQIRGPDGFDRYVWMPIGDTTQGITVRNSGRFYVTVYDNAGCLGRSDTVDVVVNPLPRPTIQVLGDTSLCDGDSVVLRAFLAGTRTYLWSTGGTRDTIVVRRAGTYGVEVTDTNGCRAVAATRTITVRPRPARATILPSDTVRVCPDTMATLTVGTGYFIVNWNNGMTGPTIRVGPGRYWCNVANTLDCWNGSDTVTVIEYPEPTTTIIALGPRVFCRGDSVRLDGGAGFARYRWNTGDSTRFIWARGAGTFQVTVVDSNGCTAVSDPIGTTEYAVPNPDIRPPRNLICRGDSIVLNAFSLEYDRYLWSTGDTTPSITVRRAGQYSVRVRSVNGCYGTSSLVDIGVFDRPAVDISGPIEICTGSRARYAVADRPEWRYTWVVGGDGVIVAGTGSNAATVRWGAAGTASISVTVRDVVTGCDSTLTIPVTIGTGLRPRIAAAKLFLCADDSVLLDAGNGYASYEWSSGERTPTIWGRPGGTYTVLVADSDGCSGRSDPIALVQVPPPTPVITTSGPTSLCAGDSVILNADPGYAVYQWNDGVVGRVRTVRNTGRYSISVVDTNGCGGVSSDVEVVVNAIPSPQIAGPDIVCRNSVSTYSCAANAGSSYSWLVTGGGIVSGQGTEQIVVQWGGGGGGSVGVEETGGTGCRGTAAPIDVTIGTQLRPVITPNGPIDFCEGDSVILDAGGGYATYRWTTGDSTRHLVVATTGTYSVAVTDANGCAGSSADVVAIRHARPIPTIVPLGPVTFFEGDSVGLRLGASYASYHWSTGDTVPQVMISKSGTYWVEVVDTNGCRGVSSGLVVTVRPVTPPPDTADVHLWIGDHVATPGERVILPIHITQSKLATSGATRVAGTLRFNRTLLSPIERTSVGWVTGGEREVPFDVDLAEAVAGGDLVQLPFIATLGNSESTWVTIADVKFTGGVVRVTADSGSFRIEGLCRDGGTRLVEADGSFGIKTVRPNPGSDAIDIEYELVEDGTTRIVLYDPLGRLSVPIVAGSMSRGRYSAHVDVRTIPQGSYTIVLISPAQRSSVAVQIVR